MSLMIEFYEGETSKNEKRLKEGKKYLKVKRFPIRKCKKKYTEVSNLLLYNGYYCAISNFNRFGGGGES